MKRIVEIEARHHPQDAEFRFRRLRKPVNWDKLRALSLKRMVDTVDINVLLSCGKDVAFGDVSQEEVDPYLLKALNLAQYSAQYLRSCQDILRSKQNTIVDALKVFRDEEELLDLEIAKYRARQRGLRREARSLQAILDQYLVALRSFDPKSCEAFEQSLADDAKLAAAKLKHDMKIKRKEFEALHGLRESKHRRDNLELIDVDEEVPQQTRTTQSGHSFRDKGYDSNSEIETSNDSRFQSINRKVDEKVSIFEPIKKPESPVAGKKSTETESIKLASSKLKNDGVYASESQTLLPSCLSGKSQLDTDAYGMSIVSQKEENISTKGNQNSSEALIEGSSQTSSSPKEVKPTTGNNSTKIDAKEADKLTPKSESPKESTVAAKSSVSSWASAHTVPKSEAFAYEDLDVSDISVQNSKPTIGSIVAGGVGGVGVGWAGTTRSFSTTAISADSVTFESRKASDSHKRDESPLSENAQTLKSNENTEEDEVIPFETSNLSVSEIMLDQPAPIVASRVKSMGPPIEQSPNPINVKPTKPIEAYKRKSIYNIDDDSDSGEEQVSLNAVSNNINNILSEGTGYQSRSLTPASVSPTVVPIIRQSPALSKEVPIKEVDIAPSKPPANAGTEKASKAGALKSYFGGDNKQASKDEYDDDEFDRESPKDARGMTQPVLRVQVNDEEVVPLSNPRSANLSHTVSFPINSAGAKSNRLGSTGNNYANTASTGGVNESWDYKQRLRDDDDVFERSGNYYEDSSLNDYTATVNNLSKQLSKNVDILEASGEIDTSMSVVFDLDQFEAKPKLPAQNTSIDIKRDEDFDDNEPSFNAKSVNSRYFERKQNPDDDDVVMRSSVLDYLNRPTETVRRPDSQENRSSGAATVSNQRNVNYDYGIDRPSTASSIPSVNRFENDDDNVLWGTAHFSTGSGFSNRSATPKDSLMGTENKSQEGSLSNSSVNMEVSWEDDQESNQKPTEATISIAAKGNSTGPIAVPEEHGGWIAGRATLDLIESAKALDVFVSIFKVEEDAYELPEKIRIKLEFAGIESNLSNPIAVSSGMHIPINFSSHLVADPKLIQMIHGEINTNKEYLSLAVHIVNDEIQETIALASINMWIMIEDSCNLPLQEAEVVTIEEITLGTIKIDIRGFRLLKLCQRG